MDHKWTSPVVACFPRHRDRDQGGPLVPVFEAVTGPDQLAAARTLDDIDAALGHPFDQLGVLEHNRSRADAVVRDPLIEDQGVKDFLPKPGDLGGFGVSVLAELGRCCHCVRAYALDDVSRPCAPGLLPRRGGFGRAQAAALTPRCYPRGLTFAPSAVCGGVIVYPPNETPEAERMEQISLLRKVRLNRGWTQAELGARARVNKTTISLIENGRFVPAAHHLQRLAEALRFPLDRRGELTSFVDR